MKTKDSIIEAIGLAEDGESRRSFLIELHKYLKSRMLRNQVDEYPKVCSFNRSCDRCDSHKYFSEFCRLQGVDPYVAHSMLRLIYAEMFCDCEYLHFLKVAEGDPEPPRSRYVTKEGGWEP